MPCLCYTCPELKHIEYFDPEVQQELELPISEGGIEAFIKHFDEIYDPHDHHVLSAYREYLDAMNQTDGLTRDFPMAEHRTHKPKLQLDLPRKSLKPKLMELPRFKNFIPSTQNQILQNFDVLETAYPRWFARTIYDLMDGDCFRLTREDSYASIAETPHSDVLRFNPTYKSVSNLLALSHELAHLRVPFREEVLHEMSNMLNETFALTSEFYTGKQLNDRGYGYPYMIYQDRFEYIAKTNYTSIIVDIMDKYQMGQSFASDIHDIAVAFAEDGDGYPFDTFMELSDYSGYVVGVPTALVLADRLHCQNTNFGKVIRTIENPNLTQTKRLSRLDITTPDMLCAVRDFVATHVKYQSIKPAYIEQTIC